MVEKSLLERLDDMTFSGNQMQAAIGASAATLTRYYTSYGVATFTPNSSQGKRRDFVLADVMQLALAVELASRQITVNCVAPGRIESEMTAEAGGDLNVSLAQAIPLGRYGMVQEVAGAVAFLASDDSSYCTGSIIDVTGGNFMP